MKALYLDANAIAKIYLSDEQGQDTVSRALDAHEVIASCAVTYAEVAGLFARAFHDGRLTEEGYDAATAAFTEEWSSVKIQRVTDELSRLAAQLMKSQRGLRALDALHLASALALRQSTPIQFLTFDARLQDAAGKLMPEALI